MNIENNIQIAGNIRAGDKTAFDKFYEVHWQELYLTALRLSRSEELAEDFTQDAFVKLWKNRNSINPSLSLISYLYTILKNIILNHIKREQVFEGSRDHIINKINLHDYSPADYLIAKELGGVIQESIESMPRKMQKIWIMSRQEHMSAKEIAEELKISPLTVKKQIANALSVLRSRIYSPRKK